MNQSTDTKSRLSTHNNNIKGGNYNKTNTIISGTSNVVYDDNSANGVPMIVTADPLA